jgi:hypothetical protein
MEAHEIKSNIDRLIEKYDIERKKYHNSALFSNVINSLARGADPIDILCQLIVNIEEIQERFKLYVERDTRPIKLEP